MNDQTHCVDCDKPGGLKCSACKRPVCSNCVRWDDKNYYCSTCSDCIGDDGQQDIVSHPAHYTTGSIEVIDFIEDQQFGYHLGQVIKYVSRAKHKGNYLQDLKKAKWYLEREIAREESK